MSSPEAAIFTILTQGSPNPLAALIGTRVYPDILPQNVTYPAIRYQLISTARSEYRVLTKSGGKATRARPRFQFDCFATTRSGANSVADALRSVLDGYQGTSANFKLDQSAIEDEGADVEVDAGDARIRIYRTRQDYFLSHAE